MDLPVLAAHMAAHGDGQRIGREVYAELLLERGAEGIAAYIGDQALEGRPAIQGLDVEAAARRNFGKITHDFSEFTGVDHSRHIQEVKRIGGQGGGGQPVEMQDRISKNPRQTKLSAPAGATRRRFRGPVKMMLKCNTDS